MNRLKKQFRPFASLKCGLLIATISLSRFAFAQFNIEETHSAIFPPSPTAGELTRYGDVPVSLSSGLPNISIPLTSYKVRDVQVPISLSYYSGGLKVHQTQSWVGLGWSLNAGGVITRTIKDRPDEGQYYPYPDNMELLDDLAIEYIDRASGRENIYFDSELDVYSFNFLGNTGKFVIDRNGKALIYPRQNFKIESFVDQSINNNGRIVITASDGTVYTFGGPGGTEYSETSQSGGTACGYPLDTYSASAFYLVKIETPTGTVVNFEYKDYYQMYHTGITQTAKRLINRGSKCLDQAPEASEHKICKTVLDIYEKRLTRIYSDGFDDITFDSGNGALLQYINDNQGGPEMKKRFALDYDFVTDSDRHFLMSVFEQDRTFDNVKTHSFEYHDKEAFPDVLSFDQDHWGFYNAAGNTSLLNGQSLNNIFPDNNPFSYYNADREPSLEGSKKGVLTKINYPTGGSTTFDFELNSGSKKELVYPTPTSYSKLTMGSPLNEGPDVNVQVHEMPSPTFSHAVNFSAHISYFDSMYFKDHAWIKIKDVTEDEYLVSINARLNHPDPSGTVFLIEGHTYELELSADRGIQVSFDLDYYSSEPVEQYVTKNVGGLRIHTIVDNDAFGQSKTRKYFYGPIGKLNISSGVTRKDPYYLEWVYSVTTCMIDPSNQLSQAKTKHLYAQLSSSSIRPMLVAGGNHISYEFVNVSYGDNFEGGGQQHQYKIAFNSAGKVVFGEDIQNPPYQDAWENGQELEVITYKINAPEDTVILNHVINEYDYDDRNLSQAKSLVVNRRYNPIVPLPQDWPCDEVQENDTIKQYKCVADHQHKFVSWFNWRCLADGADNQEVTIELPCFQTNSMQNHLKLNATDAIEYSFKDHWSYLSKSTQIQYDQNGENPITTVTQYAYDNDDHLQLTKATTNNSEGKEIISTTKYAQDYDLNSNAVFNSMKEKHMVAIPIESIKSVNGQVVMASAMSYVHDTETDQITPKDFYSYEVTSPLLNLEGFNSDETFSEYEVKGSILERDNKGNILRVKKEDDVVSSIVWGYNQSHPIANVQNAIYTKKGVIYGQEWADLPFSESATQQRVNGALITNFEVESTHTVTISVNNLVEQVDEGTIGAEVVLEIRNSNGDLVTQRTFNSNFGLIDHLVSLAPGNYDLTFVKGANVEFDGNLRLLTNSYVRVNEVVVENFEEHSYKVSSTNAHTGNAMYQGSYKVELRDKIPGQYMLTYWSSDDGLIWQQNETTISVNNTSENYSIGDYNIYIDDVRLYPLDAMITSYTYAPGIGITSQIDLNGKKTTYEYDKFGRLKAVRDHEGNILQKHQYNYASLPTN